jgi:hypothetical protein
MQQWFNLAGLSFDFIGVIMLAYEWWIALSNERRLAAEAEFERRIRPNPVFQQQMQQNNPHAPMLVRCGDGVHRARLPDADDRKLAGRHRAVKPPRTLSLGADAIRS